MEPVNSWPPAGCSHAKGERPRFQTSTGLDSRYTTCGSRRPLVNTHTRPSNRSRNSQGIFLLLVVFLLWLQDSHACLGFGREDRGFWSSGRYWTRLQSVGLGVLLFQKTQKKTHGWIYLFIFFKKKDSGANRVQHFWLACRAGMPGGRQVVVVPHPTVVVGRHTGPLRRTGADRDGRTRVPRGVVDVRVWSDARGCVMRACRCTPRTGMEGRKEKRPCLSVVRL